EKRYAIACGHSCKCKKDQRQRRLQRGRTVLCESWKVKLDTYLDGELPSEEMRTFDAHVHSCPSCAADALARVQMKRGIQAAGKRFAPSAEFRRRFQGKIPFAFDLPEVQNSEFTLLGGRMTYAGQSPGAHLIYTVRKHEISVFVFQEGAFRGSWDENASVKKELSF